MTARQPPLVLTIAGSDTSAGAGIQADIKTISMCGAYALTVVTALTAQSPEGVRAVWPVTAEQLQQQLASVAQYPLQVIKVGMLGNAALVDVVADFLEAHSSLPVILDTVIRSSSGAELLDNAGVMRLRERLMPRATVMTPNKQEARELFDHASFASESFANASEQAMQAWSAKTGVAILITGGDSELTIAGEARFCTDVFFQGDMIEQYTLPRIETPNHHGTGCTLTAAIASFMAHGFSLPEAVQHARQFVHQALLAARDQQWSGHGPLNHLFAFGKSAIRETV